MGSRSYILALSQKKFFFEGVELIKKLIKNRNAYAQAVTGVVAFLLVIVIGVMIYFNVADGVDQYNEVEETFTGYTQYTNTGGTGAGSNYTGIVFTLGNSPDGTSNTNVTCWNASGSSIVLSYPTFTVNHKQVKIGAGAASNFTQVNVTYTSHLSSDATENTDMAATVFALIPIVALTIVASIILLLVLGFGGGGKSGL